MFAAPLPARSQAPSPPPQPQYPPGNEFGVWGGYSVGNAQLIGIETNRQLGEFALRYGRTLFDKPHVALQYTLDVIPVETVRQYSYAVCMPTPNQIAYCTNGRETVYGGGVNPIGLKLNFRREHRFQPFIASTAGFVASVRPVPVDVPGGTNLILRLIGRQEWTCSIHRAIAPGALATNTNTFPTLTATISIPAWISRSSF